MNVTSDRNVPTYAFVVTYNNAFVVAEIPRALSNPKSSSGLFNGATHIGKPIVDVITVLNLRTFVFDARTRTRLAANATPCPTTVGRESREHKRVKNPRRVRENRYRVFGA